MVARHDVSFFDCGNTECVSRLSLDGGSSVRRICRLVSCYLSAYAQGMDIVEAESWMKRRKCLRGYSPEMDETLRKIYFPLGLPVTTSREEEVSVESDENGERSDEIWPSQ